MKADITRYDDGSGLIPPALPRWMQNSSRLPEVGQRLWVRIDSYNAYRLGLDPNQWYECILLIKNERAIQVSARTAPLWLSLSRIDVRLEGEQESVMASPTDDEEERKRRDHR